MSFFKKTRTTTQTSGKARDLAAAADIEAVSGGLNPQPLPPRALRTIRFLPLISTTGIGTP